MRLLFQFSNSVKWSFSVIKPEGPVSKSPTLSIPTAETRVCGQQIPSILFPPITTLLPAACLLLKAKKKLRKIEKESNQRFLHSCPNRSSDRYKNQTFWDFNDLFFSETHNSPLKIVIIIKMGFDPQATNFKFFSNNFLFWAME